VRGKIITGAIALWGFALNVALAKGWVDWIPNWIVALSLGVPIAVWAYFGLTHDRLRKYLARTNRAMAFFIFILVGIMVGGTAGGVIYKLLTRSVKSPLIETPSITPTSAMGDPVPGYAYGLALQALHIARDDQAPKGAVVQLGLILLNAANGPLKYEIENIEIAIPDMQLMDAPWVNRGGVIARGNTQTFYCAPLVRKPIQQPRVEGTLRYSIKYGDPDHELFRRSKKNLNLILRLDQITDVIYVIDSESDERIASSSSPPAPTTSLTTENVESHIRKWLNDAPGTSTQPLIDPNAYFHFVTVAPDKADVHIVRRKDRYQDNLMIYENYELGADQLSILGRLSKAQRDDFWDKIIVIFREGQIPFQFLGEQPIIQVWVLIPIDAQLTEVKFLEGAARVYNDLFLVQRTIEKQIKELNQPITPPSLTPHTGASPQ
jgi:hypothetical protein